MTDEVIAREALWKVVHAAWELLDNTHDSDPPNVDQNSWDSLSKAMDELEGLVPESEQPTWGGFPATYLWDKYKK